MHLDHLVQKIHAAYGSCPELCVSSGVKLPVRDDIIAVLCHFKELLFPGFFGATTSPQATRQAVETLQKELTILLSTVLTDKNQVTAVSAQLCEAIPHLMAHLREDVQAAQQGDPAAKSTEEVVYCYPCIEAITTYRIAHEFHRHGVPLIPRVLTEHAHGRTGIDIHPGAQIGRSFFIDHGTGVVIGETCIIGDRVRLYQGVTLGALTLPKDAQGKVIGTSKRHPTIEDDVVIYANATILGGKTVIGRESIIGSSVWLTQSVPPRTAVSMEKPSLKIRSELAAELLAYDI